MIHFDLLYCALLRRGNPASGARLFSWSVLKLRAATVWDEWKRHSNAAVLSDDCCW